MKRLLLPIALIVAVLASLATLSGGLPAALSGELPAAGVFAAPWVSAGPYPSRLDLRDQGRVTGVRSQQGYGTCWVMAAIGSLESNLLRAEGVAVDVSENNLANHQASRLVYQGMAPSELATAYFARWEGPVLEQSDPYPGPGESPDYLRPVRHVQEVLFLPRRNGPDDNDAVKWAVSEYGAVDAAIDFDTNSQDGLWNERTSSYYSTRDELDHHVTCVGWDDDYPASNFATEPPGDGAFLIRNSWGKGFGDVGYFWISYHDAGFGDALAVFNGIAATTDYDAIYQYDALGRSAWRGLGGEQAWFANRFRSAGTGTVDAVSFYTPVPGSSYEVRVAGSVAEVSSAPVAGSGTVPVAGYHTVRLRDPVAVTRGDVFVTAVHVTTPGWTEPIPLERPSSLIAPRARAGQSFVSADGSRWTDLTSRSGMARANVCLKAFVTARGKGDTRPPKATVAGGSFRRGAPVKVRWSLSDPGFSSASAVVVLSLRDAHGSLVAKRRMPAVAVGERGVWSISAGRLSGAYSVRARAYDVAGMIQATPDRAALTVRGAAVRGPGGGR